MAPTAGIVHNDASGQLSSSLIVNADVDDFAAISDTKLDTIATALKVSNSATTATSTNTADAIVARDLNGDFAAGSITADNLILPKTTNIPTGVIYLGLKFLHSYGDFATFVGEDAGNFTYTGDSNTGIGCQVLSAMTTCYNATAIGSFASIIGADSTVAVGFAALSNNTAAGVIGIGASALANNTGTGNIAIGFLSLNNNTTGSNNTALGFQSLHNNITGGNATAIGYESMFAASDNSYSTAVGYQALYSGSTYSVAVGAGSLFNAGSSLGTHEHVAIGFDALHDLNAGFRCTAVGFRSLRGLVDGVDNTAVGYNTLSFSGGNNNTVMGSNAGLILTDGSNNCLFGANAGSEMDVCDNVIAIGSNSGLDLVTGSNNIYIGQPANTATDVNTTKINYIVGEQTYVNDAINVMIDSSGTLGTISSTRHTKSNIIDVNEEENRIKISKLIPRRFDIKTKNNITAEHQSYGLIYDEVEGIADELLCKKPDGTPLTLYYQHLTIMLLKEVQRLNKRLDTTNQ